MVHVDVDFAHCEHVQAVLASIARHRGGIITYCPVGPAGGNPNLLLRFPDRPAALAFLIERYPDDDEEFSSTRIQEGDA